MIFQIGDQPGVLTAERKLKELSLLLQKEEGDKPRVRRRSMEYMQLLTLSPDQHLTMTPESNAVRHYFQYFLQIIKYSAHIWGTKAFASKPETDNKNFVFIGTDSAYRNNKPKAFILQYKKNLLKIFGITPKRVSGGGSTSSAECLWCLCNIISEKRRSGGEPMATLCPI